MTDLGYSAYAMKESASLFRHALDVEIPHERFSSNINESV